jgi:FO synthase
MLRGGANDFGGTLMEETISRMAGADFGIKLERSEIEDAIRAIDRTPKERSTDYGAVQRNRAVPSGKTSARTPLSAPR